MAELVAFELVEVIITVNVVRVVTFSRQIKFADLVAVVIFADVTFA